MKWERNSARHAAFTRIEIVVIVFGMVVIIGLTGPLFRRPPAEQRPQCQNNLHQIGIAYRTWEQDYANKYPASVPIKDGGAKEDSGNAFRTYQVMSNELNNPKILVCPQDNREPAANFPRLGNSNLSYFVGIDAKGTMLSMILGGDRNLLTNGVAVSAGLIAFGTNQPVGFSKSIHKYSGNLLCADGSVQKVTDAGLNSFIQNSGTNVIRLAIL